VSLEWALGYGHLFRGGTGRASLGRLPVILPARPEDGSGSQAGVAGLCVPAPFIPPGLFALACPASGACCSHRGSQAESPCPYPRPPPVRPLGAKPAGRSEIHTKGGHQPLPTEASSLAITLSPLQRSSYLAGTPVAHGLDGTPQNSGLLIDTGPPSPATSAPHRWLSSPLGPGLEVKAREPTQAYPSSGGSSSEQWLLGRDSVPAGEAVGARFSLA
jgi:hypothetical protein